MEEIHLFCPPDRAYLELQTPVQKYILTDPVRGVPHERDLVPRTTDLSEPQPQIFRWLYPGKALLQIACDPDFKDVILEMTCIVEAAVYNLPIGKTCYWRVSSQNACSMVRSFTTAPQPPRLIHLPNVTNVRDIGGWDLPGGKKIRQGMIYRGAQLYALESGHAAGELNAEGYRILIQQLKVRTELDLRGDEPALYPALKHISFPFSAYATWGGQGIFCEKQMNAVKTIFSLLADAENYPVYIHCAGGGDRTGTLIYLIESLLGVSDADKVSDYEYSNLSTSGERTSFSDVWTAFMQKWQEFPGVTSQEKVIAYLMRCGISQQQLETIQTLLTE